MTLRNTGLGIRTTLLSRPVVGLLLLRCRLHPSPRKLKQTPPCPYRILLFGHAVVAAGKELKSNVLSHDSDSVLSNIQSFMTCKPAKSREPALDRGQSGLASDTARMICERADSVAGVLFINLQGVCYGADRAAR